MSFRDDIVAITPRWLRGYVASRLLYSFGLMYDVLRLGLNYGLRGRAPGSGVESALPLVGADRNMPRYPRETDAEYAARLNRAFTDWREGSQGDGGAGFAAALVRQLKGFCGPYSPLVRVVARRGLWHTSEGGTLWDDPVVRFRASPDNWIWDSYSTRWWRIWVIIYPPPDLYRSTKRWDDGTLFGDQDWGLNIPPAEAAAIKKLVADWKRAGVVCEWIIWALDEDQALFDPSLATGDPLMPDATWEFWTKLSGGAKVESRSQDARYQEGVT